MRLRFAATAAVPLILLSLLTACDSGSAPTPQQPAPEEPLEPIVALPDDAVLAVTALATAGTGAVLDVSLIVHSPSPFSADGAADAWAATTAWCPGEIDDSIISGQGYSFTTVDVTATAREGEWPEGNPLLVFPIVSDSSTIAADGDLRQIDASAAIEPPDSVPHCKQPAVLDGAGSGHVYLGIAGDVDGDGDGTPPLGGWVKHLYGLSVAVVGASQPSDATLSECTAQITELGGELGAPSANWREDFSALFCVVGQGDG